MKTVIRRSVGRAAKARPVSVHDAASSFSDVLRKACALWDVGGAIGGLELAGSSSTDNDTLRREPKLRSSPASPLSPTYGGPTSPIASSATSPPPPSNSSGAGAAVMSGDDCGTASPNTNDNTNDNTNGAAATNDAAATPAATATSATDDAGVVAVARLQTARRKRGVATAGVADTPASPTPTSAAKKRATIVWSDAVEETEMKRATRTWDITPMMDEVLHRIKRAKLGADIIDGFIEKHGIFLMIVPAVGKFPALLHSIGLTDYGVPEVFVRCSQPHVQEASAIINALAKDVVVGAMRHLEDGSVRRLARPTTTTPGTAARRVRGSSAWKVRVLRDVEEIDDVNNGLLQVAATYYDRAVALVELVVQLPGSLDYNAAPSPVSSPATPPTATATASPQSTASGPALASTPKQPEGEAAMEEVDHFLDFAPEERTSPTIASTYTTATATAAPASSGSVSGSGDGPNSSPECLVKGNKSKGKSRSGRICSLCAAPSNTRFCNRCSRVGRVGRATDQFSSYRKMVKVCGDNFTRHRRGSLDTRGIVVSC